MAYQAENSAATFSDNRLARESSSSAATLPEQAPPTTWQVKITSGRAVLGQGTIRQITYFPIKVHLICGPTPPDATPWYDNTLVYRRYSELVLLRRYLLLKYTQEFVPPLPAKSTSQSFSTAMCNNETLTLQQRHAMFFVDRLSENPNLYLYDRYVAPFLQLPRDDNDPVTGGEPERVVTPSNSARSFASLTLVKAALEQEVATFERQLDQTDPNVFASGSAAVVGGWVRSTASYVSGWFGRGKNDPLSVTEDEVQRLLASEREYLRWSEIRSALIKEQQNLVDVVKSAAAVTISSKEMEQADNELQSALVSFADCLTQTSDQDLKQLVSRTCELNPTRAMIAKSTFSVAAHAENMIYNETLLLESIIETVNLLLNRYRSFAHRRLNKLSPMSPSMVHQESVDLFNIGARLGERLKVWRRGLADRFVWLNSARSKRMGQQTLGPASDIIGQSEIWQLLNSQTFMSVDALSR